MWWPGTELNHRRQLFRVKINSDCKYLEVPPGAVGPDSHRRKGRLPVKLPVSFVRLVFFLESSPRPIAFQACESRIHGIAGQDISILSSFTLRIHGIRGCFINVRPFTTITLVEPLLLWIAASAGRWRIDWPRTSRELTN
jgi:hypothetical protein